MPRPDAPTIITAAYALDRADDDDRLLLIEAEVEQDGGEHTDSELCLIWTDETLAKFARLELDAEELVGCVEAIREAHWNSEAEECKRARMRGAA